MHKLPYLFYCFSLIIGVYLHNYLDFNKIYYIVNAVFIIILTILFLIVKKSKYRIIFQFFLLFEWILLGYIISYNQNYIPKNHFMYFEENQQLFKGKIIEINNSNQNNKKYTAEIKEVNYKNKWIKTTGKALLLVPKNLKIDFKYLKVGNEYIFNGSSYPIQKATNPHQFDYQDYCRKKQLYRNVLIKDIINEKYHFSLIYLIKNLNQYIVNTINHSSLKEDSKEFLKALILGDRSDMKKENIEAYSKSGVMHLIAISGMHITLLFGGLFWVLSFFKINKKTIIICCLLFIWIFGIFVGLYSSVFRSCLMITFYYVYFFMERKSNIYHSMALSIIIILLFDVSELYSIGFQLSYIAIFSIVWLSKPIEKLLKKLFIKIVNRKISFIDSIINPLAVTFAAQIGTLPFVLYYFHQFSLLSIFINILIIPYSTFIMIFSFIEIFVIFIPFVCDFINPLYSFSVNILIKSCFWASKIDILMLKNFSLNYFELLCLSLFIIFLRTYLLDFRLKKVIYLLIFLLLFEISRLYFFFQSINKTELIAFQHYGSPLLGIREKGTCWIFYDNQLDIKKLENYLINPFITGERINHYYLISVKKYPQLITWNDQKILVFNKYIHENYFQYINKESINFVFAGRFNKTQQKKINAQNIKIISNYFNFISSDERLINIQSSYYIKKFN